VAIPAPQGQYYVESGTVRYVASSGILVRGALELSLLASVCLGITVSEDLNGRRVDRFGQCGIRALFSIKNAKGFAAR